MRQLIALLHLQPSITEKRPCVMTPHGCSIFILYNWVRNICRANMQMDSFIITLGNSHTFPSSTESCTFNGITDICQNKSEMKSH